MKIKYGLFAMTAASVLALSPALAQQSGKQGSQSIEQEQASGSGAELTVNPATVRQVQQALNQKGYDVGDVDGSWGEETAQGVRDFQQAQGIEPTGQLDMRTLSALGIQVGGQTTQEQQAKSPQQGQIGGGSGGGQQSQSGGGSSGGQSKSGESKSQ